MMALLDHAQPALHTIVAERGHGVAPSPHVNSCRAHPALLPDWAYYQLIHGVTSAAPVDVGMLVWWITSASRARNKG
jgi:hypothetical protein